jgi:hypothetical protein
MARRFNGVNESMVSASNVDLSGATVATVALWHYINAYTGTDQITLETSASFSAFNGSFVFDLDHSGQGAVAIKGTVPAIFHTFTRPSAGAWHHYLFEMDLSSASPSQVWIDGVSVSVATDGGAPGGTLGSYPLYLLARGGIQFWVAGRIDQLAIWKGVALGPSDRAAVFAGTPASAGVAPTYYWPLIGQASPEVATTGGVNLTVTGSTVYPGHDAVTYTPADPDWYFSDNWVNESSDAYSIHMGAYCKATKSFHCAVLGVSVALQDAAGLNASEYPSLRWTPAVGGSPWIQGQLVAGQTELNLTPTALALAEHDIQIVFDSLGTNGDRFNGPTTAFRVTSLTLDGGGPLLAPTLYPFTIWLKGDSIAESSIQPNSVLSAIKGWAWHFAQGMGAEHAQAGISSRGWTLTEVSTVNVPPFFTPGNDLLSSWNKLDGRGHGWPARDPRIIVTMLAQNDFDFGGPGVGPLVTASVAGYLAAERAAHPTSWLLLYFPFSRVLAAEITAGFDAYQSATPDPLCKLRDLGAAYAVGMRRTDPVSNRSASPPHPNDDYSADLGAAMCQDVISAIAPTGGGSGSRQLRRTR